MTVLPILVRELRARGLSPATYWGRSAVAALGMLICIPALMWTGSGGGFGLAGRGAFNGLVGVAFVLCCGACLLTADAISQERREGTLDLLLITSVSHWDVLLGKFASVGLTCFAGLLAFLPLLSLPLLTGGTSGGETIRNMTALVNTLFLALAAGLSSSCFGVERFRTTGRALLIVAALVFGPMLFGIYGRLVSPLGTIWLSADLEYNVSPTRFWLSICVVHSLAWALFCAAVVGIRRGAGQPFGVAASDADERAGNYVEADWFRGADISKTVKCRYCGRRNAVDSIYCHECGTELFPKPVEQAKWTIASARSPLDWLLRRQRGTEPLLWVAAAIGACRVAVTAVGGRIFGTNSAAWVFGFYWGFGLVSMGVAGALIAFATTRHLIEARREGTLELILTTPLGAEELVSTQWDIVKRMIRVPLLVMLVPSILQGFFIMTRAFVLIDFWTSAYAVSVLLGIANTVLSIGALCWVALWFAFRGMGQGRSILWSVLMAHGLPYLLSLACALLMQFLAPPGAPSPARWAIFPLLLGSLIPQTGTLLYYLFLIRLARSQLQWPGAEPAQLQHPAQWVLQQMMIPLHQARRWPNN